MKIKSTIVVATAAGSALAPNAYAADMPVKAPPAPKVTAVPAWSWAGFYLGGHLGYAWQQGETTGTYVQDAGDPALPFTNSTRPRGFIGGGQIGYNWQAGTIVYGLEADMSWLSGTSNTTQRLGGTAVANDFANVTSIHEIERIGTLRARLGTTLGSNTLVFVTGGLARGYVKNQHSEIDRSQNDAAFWFDKSGRSGHAWGGGIEHMFMNNVTVHVQALHVDLRDKTFASPNSGTCENVCAPLTIKNNATIVRVGVNVLFGPR